MTIFAGFTISFFITFFTIPTIRKYFSNRGIVDKPDFRSQHLKPIVRVGGISIFISFIITFLIISSLGLINLSGTFGISFFTFVAVAATLIFIVGLIDDLINLSPFLRLFFQFTTASLLYAGNIRIEFIQIPYFNRIDFPTFLSYLITILWIVGVTNSINWFDGLDGLTAGIIFLYTFALTGYNIFNQEPNLAIFSAIIAGSCISFIRYNRFPASIIMGDCGSNFLGFVISILSIYSFKRVDLGINLIFSFLFLSVPLLDMFFVIIRRILNQKSPFYPDRYHLHHRLLKNGFNERNTVLIIYSMAFFTSSLSIIFLKFFKLN